ncbi:protein NDRG2 isoform X2 [Heterodontus francisci]|uniref:protein NDRG2 isoform X2 n=1 Tax=Heterodontus francisci TaxID=7792 RepID=UPI00355BF426
MATELQEIQITEAKPLLPGQDQAKEYDVETPYGTLHVTIHGSPKGNRPAILTYHDVGLNHKTCFNSLFKFEDMLEITKNFVVCHIDAPGQQEGAASFPPGYQYPSMEQLCDMLPCVLQYFNFRSIIGVGVGAGAYILAKFARYSPDLVEGLVLLNIDPNAKGWMDWAASKITGLTSSLTDVILAHLFSQEELSNNSELISVYKQHMTEGNTLSNIELYWNSYNSRRDLEIDRVGAGTLKCPVMLVVGDHAPHEDAVVECNAKLDPTQTSFLKMADAGGQPQISQPGKLTEAFKYFVQGMGYMPSAGMTRLSRSRTTSLSGASVDGSRSRSRTLSQGSDGGPLASSPSQTMEVSC